MALHPTSNVGTSLSSALLAPRTVSGARPAAAGTTQGTDLFSDLDFSQPTAPTTPAQDVGKVITSTKLSDLIRTEGLDPVNRELPSFKDPTLRDTELTTGQKIGLGVAQNVAATVQKFQNIDFAEGIQMDAMQRRFGNEEFVRRLRAVDKNSSIVKRNLATLAQLEKQSQVQTAGSQSQQIFQSPTTGRTL